MESALAGQRVAVAPIRKGIADEIKIEAGAPKKVLQEIDSYFRNTVKFKDANGEWATKEVVKSSPAEILNIRQAIYDLISRTTEPNAMRLAVKYREKVDEALAAAAPRVKRVDARVSESMKQSEALQRGSQLLNTGKEAVSPTELIVENATRTPAQISYLVKGARADIERIVGTKANDVTALKQLIQSEGDWNRTKLEQLFGSDKSDRIIKAIEREATFQDAYRKVVENSQTAQRLGGVEAIKGETRELPPLNNTTMMGAGIEAARGAARKVASALNGNRQGITDIDLARVLGTQGAARDRLLGDIRAAQASRVAGQTTAPQELARALLNAQSATVRNRERR